MIGFPHSVHPTGWFQVDWSEDVERGTVKPLHIFSTDVVLYRTYDGTVRICDAYCPHLGAHLGFGGSVVGENLACPFHGWEFDLNGKNVRIPFVDRVNTRVCLRHWHTAEVDGFILVWHDALGREPLWQWGGAPEFGDSVNFHSPLRHFGGNRRVLPEQALENVPDVLHFPFVHGAGEPATVIAWREDGHLLKAQVDLKFGVGCERSWLTPNGPTVGHISSEAAGLGLAVLRFEIDEVRVAQLVAATPTDAEHSLIFSTTTGMTASEASPESQARVKGMMQVQHGQIEADYHIWEHQRYVAKPPYSCEDERYFSRFRRWASQFYAEPGDRRPASIDMVRFPRDHAGTVTCG